MLTSVTCTVSMAVDNRVCGIVVVLTFLTVFTDKFVSVTVLAGRVLCFILVSVTVNGCVDKETDTDTEVTSLVVSMYSGTSITLVMVSVLWRILVRVSVMVSGKVVVFCFLIVLTDTLTTVADVVLTWLLVSVVIDTLTIVVGTRLVVKRVFNLVLVLTSKTSSVLVNTLVFTLTFVEINVDGTVTDDIKVLVIVSVMVCSRVTVDGLRVLRLVLVETDTTVTVRCLIFVVPDCVTVSVYVLSTGT